MGEADSAFLYFESRYPDGTTAPFLVDDITIESQAPPVVEDLPPVKDTVDFPLGSAIDSRETTGASSELLLRHFDQVTPENHMKPEAWYDDARAFRIHPEAQAIMDFAQDNGDARLRPHARLAQPDPGLVLPARRRHAADDERRRQGPPADPAPRPHLQRGRDAERRCMGRSAATPTRSSPSTSSTRSCPTARPRPTACAAAPGTTSSASPTSTTPSRSRTRPSTRLRRGRGRPSRHARRSTTTTPSSRASASGCTTSSNACSIAASRSTRSATSSTSACRRRSGRSRRRSPRSRTCR